jgi:signal peptidase I
MEFNVPEDSYFMLGDNRNSSADSRYWDYPYVPKEDIVAKASFRYWKGFKWVK